MKLLSLLTTILAGVVSSAAAFAPSNMGKTRSDVTTANMAASEEPMYIDQERRFTMNLILLGSTAVTVGAFGIPYIAFFVPPSSEDAAGGSPAKDALGTDVYAQVYLGSKPANDRSLVQGLKGDATYLIVKEDKSLEPYGLNAICTHLGCVVPWSAANNKFICPCHGSQYDPTGAVVRGPAPLPLALAHCDVADDGKIVFSPWKEVDFRTGERAWWN